MEYQDELREYYNNLCRHEVAGFITPAQERALDRFVVELRDLIEEHKQSESRGRMRKAA